MTTITPTTDALFAQDRSGSGIVLLGQRCACGHVAFPRHSYGCERCGRVDGQEDAQLDPLGTVLAVATAHVQLNAAPEIPFTVGIVRLSSGPIVRAFVEAALAPGDQARGADGRQVGGSQDADRLLFQAVIEERANG
ncbi:MAG: hypothetical protein ABWY12_16940 [Burkholderiales bacterium]